VVPECATGSEQVRFYISLCQIPFIRKLLQFCFLIISESVIKYRCGLKVKVESMRYSLFLLLRTNNPFLNRTPLPTSTKSVEHTCDLDLSIIFNCFFFFGFEGSLNVTISFIAGVGVDKSMLYGRTTPRSTSRPPQVPPIPELYNIPPEARYVPCPPPGFGGSPVGNGNVRNMMMTHSGSQQNMLNSSTSPVNYSTQQSNGRIITSQSTVGNGPLSPGRGSILSTFAPNNPTSPMEHEGHLV
jgi:hypothetical protein